jgi:hypothetical protein
MLRLRSGRKLTESLIVRQKDKLVCFDLRPEK